MTLDFNKGKTMRSLISLLLISSLLCAASGASMAASPTQCPVLQDNIDHGKLTLSGWKNVFPGYIQYDDYVLKSVVITAYGVSCSYEATDSITIFHSGLFTPTPKGCDQGGSWASRAGGCYCLPQGGQVDFCTFIQAN